jgi:hypothetical protein
LGGYTYTIGSIIGAHTGAIKQKPNSGNLLSLAITESIHELLQWGRALNFEEHFIIVVCHLDVKVLDWSSGLLSLGHLENKKAVAGWLSGNESQQSRRGVLTR